MVKKFFAIGVGIFIALSILYMGNMVVNTTPQGNALGNYEYKVVPLSQDCISARVSAGFISNMNAAFGNPQERNDAEIVEAVQKSSQCTEKTLNEYAVNGWELDEIETELGTLVFRKN